MTRPRADIAAIASRLIAAHDAVTTIAPITATDPAFDVAAGYDVLREIQARRVADGWIPVGRKIGFTNRTIWPRYGVYLPMWAHVWASTVRHATADRATLSLESFVAPRIEPEVVFKLNGPVPAAGDALAVLACVEWIAPGFEIVQSHFPDWKFAAADCTAAFGLHAALVVGTPIPVTAHNRAALAAALPGFALTLPAEMKSSTPVSEPTYSTALRSLSHTSPACLRGSHNFPRSLPARSSPPVTITDAWPVAKGQTWTSDYGTLGLAGMTLAFA